MSENKWVMPHEMTAEEVMPMQAQPNWVMPHDVEAEKELSPEEVKVKAMTPTGRRVAGAKQRVSDLGRGAAQLMNYAVNIDPRYIQLSPEEAAMREALMNNPEALQGRGLVDLATGATPIGRGIKGGLAFGSALGALEPAESAGDRLRNIGVSGGLGALGGKISDVAVTGLAKGKNMLQGRYASPEVERRVRIFKENQMPGSIGDYTQNPAIMKMENLARGVGLGGDFLERQAQRVGEIMSEAPSKISGGVQSATKEDLGGAMARSIKNKYSGNKKLASDMYDEVADIVSKSNAPDINPVGLRQSAQKLLAEYPNAFEAMQDKKAVSRLESIIASTGDKKSAILGASGQPIYTPQPMSFEDARWLDKRLGSMIRQAKSQMNQGNYDPEAFGQLLDLQNSLRGDVSQWSRTIGKPEIATKLAGANQFFRENVVPFREDPVTKQVLEDRFNLDTLPQTLFKLDAPHRSEKALQFLTPEGVQAGRYYLLNEAERAGMSNALESGISPSKFLRKSQLGETGGKLFSPEELQQVDDLNELLRSSRRAAAYASDPATGNRLLSLSPLVSWKVPMAGKLFGMTAEADKPVRYMLSDPNLYTGEGALGRYGETLLRNTARGSLTDEYPLE